MANPEHPCSYPVVNLLKMAYIIGSACPLPLLLNRLTCMTELLESPFD